MLSILIPTYNFNIISLVNQLIRQVELCNIEYEIIVCDDYSVFYVEENQKIENLKHCTFERLSQNIGRSKIRNYLAAKAKYNWLLFFDADTTPCSNNLIENYIKEIDSNYLIIYGGIKYQEQKPIKNQLLRWVYGNSREALSVNERNKKKYLRFLTLNFLIHKSVFDTVSFNEDIENFRHEDTLFSYQLKIANIKIKHIYNPVYHLGLETSMSYLEKEKSSIKALHQLINSNLLPNNYISLSKSYFILKKYNLVKAFSLFYKIFNSIILINLKSSYPSLFLFDLYRLSYYITLNKAVNV